MMQEQALAIEKEEQLVQGFPSTDPADSTCWTHAEKLKEHFTDSPEAHSCRIWSGLCNQKSRQRRQQPPKKRRSMASTRQQRLRQMIPHGPPNGKAIAWSLPPGEDMPRCTNRLVGNSGIYWIGAMAWLTFHFTFYLSEPFSL